MRLRLTRAVAFRAHHRLGEPDRTAAENRARFGWTSEPHPHQYRVEVTVAGPGAPFVIDLALLDRILAEEVLERYRDRHLHRDCPEFAAIPPTCEAIAAAIFSRMAPLMPGTARLERVSVAEDDSLSAECLAGD